MSTEDLGKPESSESTETVEEKAESSDKIAEKLEKLQLKKEKSGGNGVEPPKPKLSKEEEIELVEKQIAEYVDLFDDPGATFEDKMHALINIPTKVEHRLLIRERADRLFSSIPIELFQRVFEPKEEVFAFSRPVLIHILGFLVQCTSPAVHRKFKPLMPNVVLSVCPRGNKVEMNTMVYTDMSLIVGIWADEPGDGKCIYNLLRHMTSFFAAQKSNLEVGQFLVCIKTLLTKIFQVAALEQQTEFDNRAWPVGILAVLRRLLQERTNRFTKELRKLMWEVISQMCRIGGIGWFNIDKTFVKLAIQMNHVEMQLILNDVDHLDCAQFCIHMRILELYTNAICDSEMFTEEGMAIIPRTVGDSTRYILSFWVEAYVQKLKIPTQVALSIYHFAIFLFCHEELTIHEEKVRKLFGPVMLDTAFTILDESVESDLRGEIGTLFQDMLERFSEFETLNDGVPLFIIKYLDKLRIATNYEEWKQRVVDCKCCIMDLQGRVDWYSVKSLSEAKTHLPKFTDPEQHELNHHLFKILDKLPRVN